MADQSLDQKTETTTVNDTDKFYALQGTNDRYIQGSNLATQLESKMTHPTSNGTDHTYIDQDLTTTAGPTFAKIQLTPGAAPSHSEGLMYYDSTTDTFCLLNANTSVVMNVGEETWIRVKNNTGGTISNGEVVYLNGVDTGIPTVAKAQSNSASTSLATIGFATADITTGTIGYITNIGLVRGLNTSSYSAGDLLYLSADTAGAITTTKPSSPNYAIKVGNVAAVDVSAGTIVAHVSCGSNLDDTLQIHNGQILESHTTTVTSNGTVITLTLEKTGGGDINLIFNAGFTSFDSTPAASVTLTAGSDTSPTLNYVFIPQSTNTLTANTTGFPTAQHVPVATVLCQSAASLQTDGPYKWHAWTDHFVDANSQGHISHINAWIRNQHATWLTGSALTPSVGVTTFDVSTSAGTMKQLHTHTTDAFNTATGSSAYMVNDNSTAYKKVGDFTGELTDSGGTSMSGRYYTLVFWIVGSEGSGNDKLMCNLPSGSYAGESDAIADVSSYNNYSIPQNFKGTGVLIAAVTVKHSAAGGGTWSLSQNTDLRGSSPSATAGGGSATGSSVFSDNLFSVQNVSDSTKAVKYDVSGVTTGNTRTMTVPDKDITIADNADLNTHIADTTTHGTTGAIVGISDSQTLTNKTIDGNNNTISNLAHGSEVDNPTSGVHGVTGSVVGTTDSQTLTNKTLTAPVISTISNTGTVTLPTATTTLVGRDTTDTLTNKTIDGDDNTVQDLTTSVFKTGTLQTTATDSDSAIPTSGALFDHVAEIDLNNQTGTTYELVLTDKGKLVTLSNASAITLTIPANASVAFPVGTQIEIAQLGAGQVTVAITTDTLYSSGSKTKLTGQYSSAVLTKLTSTTWLMAGDITT